MTFPFTIPFQVVNSKKWNAIKDLGSELVVEEHYIHFKRCAYVVYLDNEDDEERLIFWKRTIAKEHITQVELYNSNLYKDETYWYISLYITYGEPNSIEITFHTESKAKEAHFQLMNYLYPGHALR